MESFGMICYTVNATIAWTSSGGGETKNANIEKSFKFQSQIND
jgi:hypothetical protein